MQSFVSKLTDVKLRLPPLSIETLQVNITKLCNQACRHCHVDSSPKRREMMSDESLEQVVKILSENNEITTLDITGGAPELHPHFSWLVKEARKLGKKTIIRHNLTVTFDPHPMTKESMLWLPEFFQEQRVDIVSSLPYYREFLTDRQRGSGVFRKSILGLKLLNEQGFGRDKELILNLIYNPVGNYLPGSQLQLEKEYKRELKKTYGIDFNQLFALTNMPIHRFKDDLVRTGHFEEYMERLQGAFNPVAAEGVMCRSLISVGWDGNLYDCDFNQMLDLNITREGTLMTLENFNLQELKNRQIIFKDHCYGCTAGSGSSCGGKTVQ
ncbi:MAG TPA: arsenosugar biosynthesis radical SAM (seleno)protein ArsS [Bacteriovoracaceae bacterium]|nr:arsenosugar biosynthesis radical SAM (seleno)protein ArsS [Bacteriovoracaceae bacterium]